MTRYYFKQNNITSLKALKEFPPDSTSDIVLFVPGFAVENGQLRASFANRYDMGKKIKETKLKSFGSSYPNYAKIQYSVITNVKN